MRGAWRLRQLCNRAQTLVGYDKRNWLRIRQIEAIEAFFAAHRPLGDILEISPGWNETWRTLPAASYTSVDFPDFDICADTLPTQFDILISDQVLEHVPAPVPAVRNMWSMIRPGGWAVISTPFLFRVHARPHDYTRWTPGGLRQLLVEGGFEDSRLQIDAWGNKACARAHIGGPVRDFGFGRDLSNDPDYPLVVWAFAQKGGGEERGREGP